MTDSTKPSHVAVSVPTKEPRSALEAEIADTLWRIQVNYEREGTGPGSRFEGERLEVVQARWAIRRLRESAR